MKRGRPFVYAKIPIEQFNKAIASLIKSENKAAEKAFRTFCEANKIPVDELRIEFHVLQMELKFDRRGK